jgi:DNA mismatch repair ATPase MutS
MKDLTLKKIGTMIHEVEQFTAKRLKEFDEQCLEHKATIDKIFEEIKTTTCHRFDSVKTELKNFYEEISNYDPSSFNDRQALAFLDTFEIPEFSKSLDSEFALVYKEQSKLQVSFTPEDSGDEVELTHWIHPISGAPLHPM